MFKILCDGKTLYHPLLKDYCLSKAVLTQETNKAGTLDITIPAINKAYGIVHYMQSTIELYDDNRLIFRGRPYAPSRNLFSDSQITVAGEISFLYDTLFEPFEYFGTVAGFFNQLITAHNSQVELNRQFKVGICDVVNSTVEGNIERSSESVMQIGKIVEEKLTKMLGGYLRVRHEADGNYIDYLKDPYEYGNQDVTQCINLIKFEEELDFSDLATVIYPLGAKVKNEAGEDTKERINIESVNGGSKYLEDAEGIRLYGRIYKVVYFDDITEASNLLTAGYRELGNAKCIRKMKISAADLSKAGYKLDSFRLGQNINLKIDNLGISQRITVNKLKTDLLSPESSLLEVGNEKKLTDHILNMGGNIADTIIKNNITEGKVVDALDEIIDTKEVLSSEINQTAKSITATVSENFYNKNDVDNLVGTIESTVKQTKDDLTVEFSGYANGRIEELQKNVNRQFEEFKSYIRFTADGMELGKSNNPLILKVENNNISFYQNGSKVAYFTDQKLYVTDGEFKNALRLGNFEFQPRENGNLSFVKVGDLNGK